jgi:hypothetical protein
VGSINFFAGVVDSASTCIYLDLGNALSTSSPGGPLNDLGDLTLNIFDPIATPDNPAGTLIPLSTIPGAAYSQDPQWYANTAGVVALALSAAQLQAVAASQLVLSGNSNTLISEWSSGAFVRADRFVYRVSPNEQVQIPVYAMQWGQPLAGVVINFQADPSQLQIQEGDNIPVATPADALVFNSTATTDATGSAVLTVNTSDPGTPRYFNNGIDYGIDGQVYGIRPAFADSQQYDGPVNQWNFISFLLWSGFTPANPVTWADLQPIFQQYANLYPVMSRFLNLANYDSVVANTGLLQLAFGLNPDDPNSMPVTRDLSPAKRNAILKWLNNPLPAPADAPAVATAARAAVTTAPTVSPALAQKGGKAAAAARRLILKKQ